MNATLGSLRPAATALALGLVLACGGRGQAAPAEASPKVAAPDTATPAPPAPDASPSPITWLTVDSASRTASLTLEVTAPPNSPSARINGYRNGEARIVVPVGWTVKWNWRNADTASPHSLVVMVQREKVPLEGGRSSFSNAMTRMVTEGLPPGQTDQATFVAEEAGWYWLMCGMPGHALKGEWIELRLDPEATTARVEMNGNR
jgi:sulfocyanin SoxE-like protein